MPAGRNERLIQTMVPKSLLLYVKAQAAAEGISVSSYVRRLILRDRAAMNPPLSESDSNKERGR